MRASQVTAAGEPSAALRLRDVVARPPGEGQIAVHVLASAANSPDVLMCRGAHQVKLELAFTPSKELAGEVIAIGDRANRFRIGDRVIGDASLPSGGFAGSALTDETDAFLNRRRLMTRMPPPSMSPTRRGGSA
jgi:NADPH2:quinone reductase